MVLTHTGRAVISEQESQDGKWWTYPGFRKSLELYNLDLAILDNEAHQQAVHPEHVIIVEGCFDVAKLWAAGIKNVVATLEAHLCPDQLPRFELLSEMLGVERFLIWYDRDQDGGAPVRQGGLNAVNFLRQSGYEASAFEWERHFPSSRRGAVPIPDSITDPCEFSIDQLRWLREECWI